jgi:hypothetical protein
LNSFNRYHFLFIYMCTQHLHHIPRLHLSLHPSPPTGTSPPERTCCALLFFDLVTEKNDFFVCL